MDKNTIALFSSKKTDHWQTPKHVYDALDGEFFFDFDLCPLNPLQNGLTCQWGKRNFVNPPYSNVIGFLRKAWQELEKGNADLCVFLTFANTDTKWFHDYLYHKAELRFIKGRIKFLSAHGKTINSAMRPSMIAILTRSSIQGS